MRDIIECHCLEDLVFHDESVKTNIEQYINWNENREVLHPGLFKNLWNSWLVDDLLLSRNVNFNTDLSFL
jgi:hypothetical protein